MQFLQASILWVTLLIMLAGLFSLLFPILPGLLIMWLAALGYGIAHGFDTFGLVVMVLITILTLIGSVIDNIFMGAGAKKGGASWSSILIALLAGLVGTLLLPPFGGFIAAPLAVFLMEYLRLRDWQKAWQALRGLAIGWGAAVAVRFVLGLGILSLWIFWVFQSKA